MGREVRRVAPWWQHPIRPDGQSVSLRDGIDFVPDQLYALAHAEPAPDPADYMPRWSTDERTHLQMYCRSSGTPMSPVCATPEELAAWLTEHGARAFDELTASYDEWLAIITIGTAPPVALDAERPTGGRSRRASRPGPQRSAPTARGTPRANARGS